MQRKEWLRGGGRGGDAAGKGGAGNAALVKAGPGGAAADADADSEQALIHPEDAADAERSAIPSTPI